MKLKVAIYDSDLDFMNRLANIFQKKYADKVSLSIFSNVDTMYKSLEGSLTDVVLLGRPARVDPDRIPEGTLAGYLSVAFDIDQIEGVPAICKYQKAEAIYKQILSLYAENAPGEGIRRSKGKARVVLFTSVQGGGGTSTAAAAYAMRIARRKKAFYLNLERFGDADLYFNGDGKMSFSDVLYTLHSRKGNLSMKIESAVKTDPSGADFFSPCRNVYDMFEFSEGDLELLIEGVSSIDKYQEIVVDVSGDMTELMTKLMSIYADKIVYVSDGSATGNGKFERFCEAARVTEQREKCGILEKTCLLYNRYSSKYSAQLTASAIPVVGGIHRYEGIAGRELCEKIAGMDVFDQI